jgi:isopenicillin N synthase-like dioxygenase
MVADHGIDPALIAQGLAPDAGFLCPARRGKAALRAQGQGRRAATPLRYRNRQGRPIHDLKEFWHIGRDLPAGHPLGTTMPPNIWPERPEHFAETFTALFAEFDRVGSGILSHLALALGLAPDWFAPAIADGNSVLRLLHYPPIADAPEGPFAPGHTRTSISSPSCSAPRKPGSNC